MPSDWYMEKQNVLYPSNRVLFSNEEGQNNDTCYNMSIRLSERSPTKRTICCMISFILNSQERPKRRLVFA